MEEKDHHKNWLNEKVTLAKWREEFCKSIIHELKTEERYVNYFKNYEPSSVENFIGYYADMKVTWYEHGDSFAKHAKKHEEEWFKEGVEALRKIQAKKLFNLICQWVNYEIELPGIEISEELIGWQHNLFTCPYLKPVQEHELNTYISFINNLPNEEKYNHLDRSLIWSHSFFAGVEPRWSNTDDYSLWFRWYDDVYNTGDLKDKPASRINKERYYRNVKRDHSSGEKPASPEVVHKPPLYHFKYGKTFVKKFETPEYRALYEALKRGEDALEFDFRPQLNISELSKSDSIIPIESNEDWRTALDNAAELLKRSLVIEELPFVYKEYCSRLKSGEGFEGWKEIPPLRGPGWVELYKEDIKKGRAILGEPADLNF